MVVGVGSGGCRIASQLQRFNVMADQYAYISCGEEDLAGALRGDKLLVELGFQGKAAPRDVRAAARRQIKDIQKLVSNARLVFVIAGMGGAEGTALAPIVAKEARDQGAAVVAFVAMPHSFEKNKHFYSAIGLKHLQTVADSVVIVDNSEVAGTEPETPLADLYAMVNEKIGFALNKIITSSDNGDYPLGLRKFLGATSGKGYSVFTMGTSEPSSFEEAVSRAVRGLNGCVEPTEAKEALLYVVGDTSLTARHLDESIGMLTSMMNQTVGVQYGFSTRGKDSTMAILIASGFSKTKFDHYDPIAEILGDRIIDSGQEEAVDLGFETFPSIEI
ncbi:MAG: hypothetical protein HYU39_05565 [Thaumarchaeota archaeon]|nr:hypothetical protein [Nitrososphaerota archaeon]